MDHSAEARKKSDQLMKAAAATIETAEQTAETSRDLLLDSKRLRKVLERFARIKGRDADSRHDLSCA